MADDRKKLTIGQRLKIRVDQNNSLATRWQQTYDHICKAAEEATECEFVCEKGAKMVGTDEPVWWKLLLTELEKQHLGVETAYQRGKPDRLVYRVWVLAH